MEPKTLTVVHEGESYVVQELTGLDIMDISSRAIRESPDGFPDSTLWTTLLVTRAVKSEPKLTVEELKSMPAKLYQKLSMAAQRLNTLSPEEQSFLSTQ